MAARVTLIAAMLAALLAPVSASAGPGDAPVTGSLFVDFARNGTLDSGDSVAESDPLFPPSGITVTATDVDGNSVDATVTPGTPPTYSIDPTTLTGSDYRLEFILDPADVALGWTPTVHGPDSASSVQFVSAGAVANFGVLPPTQCGGGTGDLFITCHTIEALTDTVIRADYDAPDVPTTSALEGDTGSVWGLAYDEWTDTIWTASMHRRGFDQGTAGLGGLYSQTANGAWIPHDLGAGFDGAIDPTASDYDSARAVARIGMGDIDLHSDGRTLFVANVATNTVHVYDVSSGIPVQTATVAIPNPGCAAGDSYQIWATKATSATTAFVGATCTADFTQVEANLTAHVFEISTAGAVAPVAGLSPIPLDYTRGCGIGDPACTPNFQPWTDSSRFMLDETITKFGGDWNTVMQPLLSDIEVGVDGDLVLGFIDRSAMQHDEGTIWDDPSTAGVDEGAELMAMPSGGDLLHVNNAGTLEAPTYVLENVVGGSEHFAFETIEPFHQETASGSVYVHPALNQVVAPAIDPLRVDSYGVEVGDVETGASIAGYELGSGERAYKATVLGDIEGCFAPVEIGDRVWLDLDNDGIQDPTEQALEGVTVTLRDAAGNAVAETTTDANGIYTFDSLDGLEADTAYVVQFDVAGVSNLPAGLTPALLELTGADAGSSDAVDSDAAIDAGGLGSGLPEITVTTGGAGTVNHTLDAGFAPPPDNRIGNLVWLDTDNDGVVDPGEPGIQGMTVELYEDSTTDGTPGVFDPGIDTLVDTTTTDATGNYWFEDLREGPIYFVAVPEDQSANTLLVGGQGLDPGTIVSSTGGDLTNNDVDNMDDGEPATGFSSVSGPIDLEDGSEATGETDANTSTDAEAHVEGAGADDIADDRSNLTVDLGFTQLNRIGNLVWVDGTDGDANYNNGIADAAETGSGIGGVTVQLFEDSSTGGTPGVFDAGIDMLVDTTTTDNDGSYWFDGVPDGMYFVGIPSGQTGQTVGGAPADLDDYVSSTAPISDANAGLDDVDDGDPAPGFASLTGAFEVGATDNPTDEAGDFQEPTADGAETDINTKGSFVFDENSDLTIDFGFVEAPKYSVGNLVWVDLDDDGLAEIGEPGIEGVVVNLYDDADNLVDTTTTDVNGNYLFEDLAAGDYRVAIPTGQTGQIVSGATVDLDDLLPSQVVTADPDDPADVDNDNNGFAAVGEITSGLVSLGDPDLLNPTEPTNETLRADDMTDDDDGGLTTDEQRNLTVDFGFVQPLRVGNLVWLDDGGDATGSYTSTDEDDGQADPAELGIEGVLVQLLDSNSVVIAETVTDGTGNYWFDDLRPGDYQVGIPISQTPVLADPQPGIIAGALDGLGSSAGQSASGELADDDDDGDPSGAFASLSLPFNLDYGDEATDENGDFADATAGAAEAAATLGLSAATPDENSNLEIDFGFSEIPTYRLGNRVWVETDDDGIAEDGEPGIEGLLVQLLNDAGTVIAETVTDADGLYLFDDLPAGDYQVRIPDDQNATLGGTSGTPGLFDDYRTAGTPEPDADANADNDNNGVEDALGLTSGVVTLGDLAGEPVDETVRDDDATLDEDGTMIDARSNLTVDFGLTPLYRLGNLVWEDYDNDGIAEDGEPAIEGVLVQLLDETGTVVAETVTDVDGHYEFAGLEAGDYRVNIPGDQAPDLAAPQPDIIAGVLDGLTTSGTPEGDANNGSDNDNNGVEVGDDHTSGVVTLGDIDGSSEPTGETLRDDDQTLDEDGVWPDNRSDLTVDFGFFRGLRLGNQVFLDGEQGEAGYNNGVFDPGEFGIAGVEVELWQDDGDGVFDPATDTLVTTDMTDGEGNYAFDNVQPDTPYFVAVAEMPMGFSSSGASGDAVAADNVDDADPGGDYSAVTSLITLDQPFTAPTTTGEVDTNPAADEAADDEANAVGDFYPDGNSEMTVDLGFIRVPLYRIGNLVWDDLDNDGIAEDGEAGINGVTVNLLDETGGIISTTQTGPSPVTGEDGWYEFPNLVPGDYQVSIPMDQAVLEGKASSDNGEELVTNDDGDNNDNGLIDGDSWTSSVVSVGDPDETNAALFGTEPADETLRSDDPTDDDEDGGFYRDDRSNYTVDFGFLDIPTYEIGNLVWVDSNDDGIADVGEPGIGGVDLQLLDELGAVVQTTTTLPDGSYLFTGLDAGNYQVVIPPGQTGQTIDDGGATPVDLQDLLPSSVSVPDPDAPVDIDNDSNGVPQADGTISAGFVTVGDDGTGVLDELNPAEPTDETDRAGGTDIDPSNDVDDARQNATVDFGFAEPLRVGNLVWLDDGDAAGTYVADNEDNGIADAGESGIEGVLVQLLDDTGTVVAETVTNATGNYLFDDLYKGDYRVGIPVDQTPVLGAQPGIVADATDGLQSSEGQSLSGEVADDDDDGDPTADFISLSDPFNLDHNTEATDEGGDFDDTTALAAEAAANALTGDYKDANSNLEIDLGLAPIPTYRLGNLVWEDIDDDGVAEAGEPVLAGVLVQLLDDSGAVIAETVTDGDGHYLFEDLEAGDYQVRLPADQTPVLGDQPDLVDGVLDGLRTSGVPTADADDDVDNDNNGVESADGFTSGVVTLGEGSTQEEPTGETARADDATLDEDGSLRDDRSNLTVDFGLYRGLRLGNQVFRDGEQGEPGYNNGIFDPGEAGISGVTVELWEDDGDGVFDPTQDTLLQTTVTDDEGNYSFGNLEADVPYLVAIEDIGAGTASEVVSAGPTDADNDNDGAPVAEYVSVSQPVTLTVGATTTGEIDTTPAGDDPADAEADAAGDTYPDANSELSVDFGFIDVPLYRIGNLVWEDVDNDGLAETGEAGIAGVTVQLLDASGAVIDEVITDADGKYEFGNLPPGDYQVAIPYGQDALAGFASSNNGEETDTNADGDNNDNGLDGADAWISAPVRVGPDPVEPPLDSEPTDESLRVDDPTDDDPGDSFYTDGRSNYSVDFGFYRLALGSQVWLDTDGNGSIDAGEPGIDGVPVLLYVVEDDGSLTQVDETVTEPLNGIPGSYLFEGLESGETYVVEIPAEAFEDGGPLADLYSSPDPAGGAPDADDDPTDEDDNGTDAPPGSPIQSLPVTLVTGEEPTGEPTLGSGQADANENLTVDFGVTALSLGGTLWEDVAEDGILGAGSEPVIPGVPVELWEVDPATGEVIGDEPIAVTETAPDGTYQFAGLAPGDYVVRVPADALGPNGPLAGMTSTTGNGVTPPDPDDDVDLDDNGQLSMDGYVQTAPVSLDFGDEPLNEAETGPAGDASDNNTVDLGFVVAPPMSLGNRVWQDLNRDGIQDPDEEGISGVVLELVDPATGEVIATTTTDADGYYLFDNLLPGTYVVRVPAENPALVGHINSDAFPARDPDDDTTDQDDQGMPVGLAIESPPITLVPTFEPIGEADLAAGDPGVAEDMNSNLTVDFGFFPNGDDSRPTPEEISGALFYDINNNGVMDEGEPPLVGVEITITNDAGDVVAEVVTDENGFWQVQNLAPGEYLVTIEASNFLEGGALEGLLFGTGAEDFSYVIRAGDEPALSAFGNRVDRLFGLTIPMVPVSAAPVAPEPLAFTGGSRQYSQFLTSLILIGLGFFSLMMGQASAKRRKEEEVL